MDRLCGGAVSVSYIYLSSQKICFCDPGNYARLGPEYFDLKFSIFRQYAVQCGFKQKLPLLTADNMRCVEGMFLHTGYHEVPQEEDGVGAGARLLQHACGGEH